MLILPPKHILNLFTAFYQCHYEGSGLSWTTAQTQNFPTDPICLQCLPFQSIVYTCVFLKHKYDHVPFLFWNLHWLLIDNIAFHSIFHFHFPPVHHTQVTKYAFCTSLPFHIWLYQHGMSFTCFSCLFWGAIQISQALILLLFILLFQGTLFIFFI